MCLVMDLRMKSCKGVHSVILEIGCDCVRSVTSHLSEKPVTTEDMGTLH